ncbi:MAG: hypothetical protein JNM06_09885 [Blastocatellia bacterium]|nr:hypothetical protein [Blastocatellia bacterium]MBN8722250.1 hypothetical protein [Acidobacteriota bacterium]
MSKVYNISIYLFISLLLIVFTQLTVTAQKSNNPKKVKKITPGKHQLSVSKGKTEHLDKPKLRALHFSNQRTFPFGIFPLDWREKALEHVKKNQPNLEKKAATNEFTAIGPAPINNGQTFGNRNKVSGRVTSIAINPEDPKIVYLGAAQGGVWRTTDAGQNWQPMTDDAPTQAVGAVALDPTNPNIIYVGTGEGNLSGDSFFGMGILKSTDGGKTWVNLANRTFLGLSFSNLLIDPRDTKILYASIANAVGGNRSRNPQAGTSGIYKSIDGGVNWTNVLKVGESVFASAVDIEMDPSNSSILFASIFNIGVFKSTDAGQTWSMVRGGLPTQEVSRVDIGIAPSNSNIVYASAGNSRTGDLLDIYKSTDAGNTWRATSRPPQSGFGNICQCFYDNRIVVDPDNPDTVYYGGVALYRSTNGGQSWIDISSISSMHPDFHAIQINRSAEGKQIYIGNDGGVWSSLDDGKTWNNINAALNITQFQSIALHPTNTNISLGGTQDNGTNLYQGDPLWQHSDDGDGGFAAIDQDSPNIMYHTYFSLTGFAITLVRSESNGRLGTWRRANEGLNPSDDVLFYSPFIIDPNNQSRLYYGTSRLYRTENRGDSWQPISNTLTNRIPRAAISAIAVSPNNPNSIYTGSSDGAVFASQNGNSFQNVTDNLPTRYVSDVVVDPTSPNIVYVSLGGFQSGHVFKSTSGGNKWQDISGNLPDVPTNALVINPVNARNLFAGTDIGVFQTLDGGNNWQLIAGMPVVSVFDLAINTKTGILQAATHGRGIYQLKLLIDASAPTITVSTPNGGEKVTNNSPFTIKWVSDDDVGVTSHDIELSTDGGTTFPVSIANGLAGTTQEFIWSVPLITSSQARIRITAIDSFNNRTIDISDENFAIEMTSVPDFGLDFGFTVLTAKRGQTVTAVVRIIRSGGFSENITIIPDANMLKTLKIKAKPASLSTQGNNAEFSLKIKKKAPLGKQLLNFVATDSQGRAKTGTLMLMIE